MMKIRHGFTLAEVLTTLMVIGVVAAMTIPTLMNSTNDQQYKVAFKKAMSILSQGTQLMVAKEAQCTGVKDGATLAKCFKDNVLTGELVGKDGTPGANDADNFVIKTADGLAYAFYYRGTDFGAQGNGADAVAAKTQSLDEICGVTATLDKEEQVADRYNGKSAKCFVVVDLNGTSKGSKEFADDVMDAGDALSAVTKSLVIGGADTAAMVITGDGIRPLYVKDAGEGDNKQDNAGLRRGYEYMYGDVDPTKEN